MPDEGLRSPRSTDDADEAVRALLKAGEHVPDGLRDRILGAGAAAVPGLIDILADHDLLPCDAPGEGWAPIHAAEHLIELRAEEAIEPMLDLLAELDSMETLHSILLEGLRSFSELALEPALRSYQRTDDREYQSTLALILSELAVSDPRVFDVLVEQLERDPDLIAGALAEYGDPAALPHLARALDQARIGDSGNPFGNQHIIELGAAVEEFGGSLTASQRAKHELVIAERRRFRSQIDEALDARDAGPTGSSARTPKKRKVGRNDPCPCGSGKKHKMCCLGKAPPPEPEPSEPDPEPDDGALADDEAEEAPAEGDNASDRDREEDERWRHFWDEYGDARLDEKLRMARGVIDEKPSFEGELAFELLSELIDPLVKAGQTAEAEALLDHVEQQHPDAVEQELGYFMSWRVEIALAAGGDVRTPLLRFAADPCRDIDRFFRLTDMLRYHGRSDELLDALRLARPLIHESDELMPHAQLEVDQLAVYLAVDQALVDNPNLAVDDAALREALEPVLGMDIDWLARIIEHRSGRATRAWTREDFPAGRPNEATASSLALLAHELVVFLCSEHGWPRGRAELARSAITEHLVQRAEDQTPPPSAKRTRKKGKRGRAKSPGPQLLMPTPESADEFAARAIDMFSLRYHYAGAFLQAIPLWVRLLADRGLVSEKSANSFLGSFRKRLASAPDLFSRMVSDKILHHDMKAAFGPGSGESG